MNPLVAGAGGALLAAGVLAIVWGAIGREPVIRPARRPSPGRVLLQRRTLVLAGAGFACGIVIALVTGWVAALVLAPAAFVVLPFLLSPSSQAPVETLEAMEEWTRSLAGILTAGAGLEQAIISTAHSTPEAIRPAVMRLIARLRARWTTAAAIRAFADDLDDATGDLIALNLLLGAQRRGAGLAQILESLAAAVADDVRARRQIEADQAKPRATARWVTLITAVVLLGLFLAGDYADPYRTPIGQIVFIGLIAAYLAVLLWMRRMAQGRPVPRLLTPLAEAASEPGERR
ncbi:MAG: type II secretion system F family protein [Propionibacteriaceae bacterium]|jgi:Flp pilus assembly protein TadB|nr:type II secretion system F family protein [Propionibacteriaceae bacterium]